MIGQVCLHKDDNYAIQLTRDMHNGIHIQLISFMPRMLPNSEDVLEEHLSDHLELSFTVKVRHLNHQSGQLELNKNFKKDVADAVAKCQHQLAIIQQNHEYIEGTLKDYASRISK